MSDENDMTGREEFGVAADAAADAAAMGSEWCCTRDTDADTAATDENEEASDAEDVLAPNSFLDQVSSFST